ncbi:hypothetical protein H0H81_004072 [Sphagnurus paluster]|uniref:Uncharacterized protein n=1 Tax=Sphagnurus paluster TaxID=117069 RepID=A0A9P7GT57_9AGAR|nr:hypothetical protein H0H81_004072 [Sphagnurus paluster]
MKVYIAAIAGRVPDAMVQSISTFMDACYIARRDDLNEKSIKELEAAVARFHHFREVFRTTGVRPEGFSLPRQHSLSHYADQIRNFGAPNGLSSRVDFISRGMLPPDRAAPPLPFAVDIVQGGAGDFDALPIDDAFVTGNVVLARTRESPRRYPPAAEDLATTIGQPKIAELIWRFLFDQINTDDTITSNTITLDACPEFTGPIRVYHSAVATFYAPSDDSGVRGMRRECIRSTPSWRGQGPRRDCAFVVKDVKQPGMKGMSVVRAQLFFSFDYIGVTYPCALVEWFKTIGRSPDPVVGMWKVVPDVVRGERETSVLHLDTFLRGAHLLPVFGQCSIPVDFHYLYSLDVFNSFYVNRFADHHSHEICY